MKPPPWAGRGRSKEGGKEKGKLSGREK